MRTPQSKLVWAVAAAWTSLAAGAIVGPYNGSFISSGTGIEKRMKSNEGFGAGAPFSMYCWFRSSEPWSAATLIAGAGDPIAASARFLGVADGRLGFWNGEWTTASGAPLTPREWHFAAVTFDGRTLRLFSDGAALAEKRVTLADASPVMNLAPEKLPWPGAHFAGRIAGFTVSTDVLDPAQIASLAPRHRPFDLMTFEEGSKCWPFQTRAQAGYRAPQDPGTLPQSASAPQKPQARPVRQAPVLEQRAPHEWALANGWQMIEAPRMQAGGADLSRAGYQAQNWYAATVPGTVLTTLIDRGVYPDPDYGLNNLAIPESLSRQNYWYRVEFTSPRDGLQRWNLTFLGINFAAEVWLNGKRLGDWRGAFLRGDFDVTNALAANGRNALAVLISPPPHPGIGHEQSIKAGAGENGGTMCLDGPTFVCTEGWDWIPAIRDRDTGIWQDVVLRATGAVRIGDVRVVTKLPLPRTDSADITITAPLRNTGPAPIDGVVRAAFEGVELTERVIAARGETAVTLVAHVSQPRLWWPNGYGRPELYHLRVSFTADGGAADAADSDAKALRFGIREITYELSLLDPHGAERRVEFAPEAAAANHEHVVDVRHEGIVKLAEGWVYSIEPGEEQSASLKPLTDLRTAPFLVVRVNGVRIVCKGGSWGIDDSRKRISREHLEPFFRLHRDANLTMIRNWVGQSTEDVFYDLADEYGLLVWNDFWESTQNYNVEPSDSALFLANARDTISRYRNHPSIVVWCGRNEGVPPPAINEGLDEINRDLDGTRMYMPGSNQIELQDSGPYKYRETEDYFTKLSRGFAVEVGIPSFPTLEAFQAAIPLPDQWPPSDSWAYHDWHFSGNGDTHPFMTAIEQQFGAAANLEEFERKAQMINYVNHRAIFEGMNAHLWNPNSGRMLWMTQPAWPSTNWQILSADYDTQASFYGAKKGCEPVHVQMNLPDLKAAVVNNTAGALRGLTVSARTFGLDGQPVSSKDQTLDAEPLNETELFPIAMAREGVTLVKLELRDPKGTLLSENFYWYAADPARYRDLNGLPPVNLHATATRSSAGGQVMLRLRLENASSTPALMTKITLVNSATATRILPAYFSDNYVSLLPGEARTISIEAPESEGTGALGFKLRGWNVAPAMAVTGGR